jgi:membrane protein required for colicin V production
MAWIDVLIVVVVALSALISLFRGFLKEFISLLTWVVAIWLAIRYSDRLAGLLPASLDQAQLSLGDTGLAISNLRVGLAFVLVVIAVLVLGAVLKHLIAMAVTRGSLSLVDRGLGVIFGVMRGAAIVVILVLAAGLTRLPQTPWWHDARLLPPFQKGALWVIRHLPSGYADYFSYT